MALGVFGKIPQKADFVTVNLPLPILRPFEQWLDTAIAGSRAALGDAWQAAYLIAPIWHFQFGEAIFGFACRGAIMSSVDAVGRFFPLAVFDWVPDGATGETAPGWDDQLETEMLSVLASDETDALDKLQQNLASGWSPTIDQDFSSIWWQLGQADPTVFPGLPPPAFYATMIQAKPCRAQVPAEDDREAAS